MFLFSKICTGSEAHQPPIQYVPSFFSGVKRPGPDNDHWPPCTVEVENEWGYTSAPSICVNGVDRDNFTFLPILFQYLPRETGKNHEESRNIRYRGRNSKLATAEIQVSVVAVTPNCSVRDVRLNFGITEWRKHLQGLLLMCARDLVWPV
jgi:hypothetical protein